MILNEGQHNVVNSAVNWYNNSSDQVFEFTGSPGTGKSLVLNCIIQELGLDMARVAPAAFSGAAAIVMRLKGLCNAKTLHSWLFTPVQGISKDKGGRPIMNNYLDRPLSDVEFVPKKLSNIDLLVIDEGGMVPYWMKSHIESQGIKVLVSGDQNQLPAISDKPAYLNGDKPIMELTEIMRQEKGSSIVYLSQRAKDGLPIHCGFYGNVLVIEEDQVTDKMLMMSNILLCGKNDTRDKLNKRVREDILGIVSDIPVIGDRLVCKKNNWAIETDGISLANGLVGSVVNNPDVSGFNGKTFTIDFRPDLLYHPFKNLSCDYTYFIAPYQQRKMIKNNKYSLGEKFEFAYACTTHTAQGSEYPFGMYFEEYLSPEINNNLNFTGITRFSNGLIYVKPKRKFY